MSPAPARTALVTGAARGIGAAVVDALCVRGYRVVAVDACAGAGPGRPAGVDYPLATRADLAVVAERNGDRVLPLVADVRDRPALAAAVAEADESLGGLDAVVAAAAVMTGGALWETTDEQLAAQWDVTVRGVWNTAVATVPALLDRPQPRSGRFVAVASAAAHRGLWGLSAYGAAKHAVVGIVRGLAADLRDTGVGACAVSAGSTDTAMLSATAGLYGLDPAAFADNQLLGRLLDPAEVGGLVAGLCGADAAAVNGSVVHADGGFTG